MTAAYDAGVNFSTTPKHMPWGCRKRSWGQVLKKAGWRRSSYVISTKFFWGLNDGPNEKNRLSRKYLMEAIDGSLKRLQMDYVDLIFCHRADPKRRLKKRCGQCTTSSRRAKRCIGERRNGARTRSCRAWHIADKYSSTQAADGTVTHNMPHRDRVEKEYARLYKETGLGATIWSPLASGLLTGKYNDGIPTDSRAALKGYEWFRKMLITPQRIEIVIGKTWAPDWERFGMYWPAVGDGLGVERTEFSTVIIKVKSVGASPRQYESAFSL